MLSDTGTANSIPGLMANASLSVCILFACLAPQCALGESDVTQCLSDDAGIAETSLLQKAQARQKLIQGFDPSMLSSFTNDHEQPSEADDVSVGEYGLATLPARLVDRMVISNPYKCKFLPGPGDAREAYCDKTMLEAGLYPGNSTAGGLARLDSLRTLLPIGALPCCSTAPFCAAPDCVLPHTGKYLLPGTYYQEPRPQAADNITCTKRNAASNFAYMAHPDVWLAYRLAGGSLDLDVQKHWDILGTLHTMKGPKASWHLHTPWVVNPSAPPFDLVIDLGANFGLVTEKLVMRRFAKDYILVEADPELRQIFDGRFGNSNWRDEFVKEQTATWQGADPFTPNFEYMNFALSDRAGGLLDTCSFNWRNSFNQSWTPTKNCSAEMASVDSIIPGRLSPEFADRFAKAQSAYVKVDVEGMDQMVVNGMKQLLAEKRGDNYLVNFMMLEFCAPCMEAVRLQNLKSDESYDLKTFAETLESQGFEAFLVGPRFIPLTHGSWDDAFVNFSKDPENQGCDVTRYPKIKELMPEWFPNGECEESRSSKTTFTADIFALRVGHPRAEEIKVLLGACKESHDFNPIDPQYDLSSTM